MKKRRGGYNRYNFLKRVQRVNEIYLEYSSKGVTAEYIYRHYIYPEFFIGKTTFWKYLTIPYKSEQKEIERQREAQRQSELPFEELGEDE